MDIQQARKVVVLSMLVGAALGIAAIFLDQASRTTAPTDSTPEKAHGDAGTRALSPEEEMAELLEWRKQYRAFHEGECQRADGEEAEAPPPVFAATGPDPRKTVAMGGNGAILPSERSPRKRPPPLPSTPVHHRRPSTEALHLLTAKLNHTKLTTEPEILWDTAVPALPLANLRPRLDTAVSPLKLSYGPPTKSKSAQALSALLVVLPPPPGTSAVVGSSVLHHRRTAQQPSALSASPMPPFAWDTAAVDDGDEFGFFEDGDEDGGDDAREGRPLKGVGGSWCALEAANPRSAQTAYRQAYRAHRTEAAHGPSARGDNGGVRGESVPPGAPFGSPAVYG